MYVAEAFAGFNFMFTGSTVREHDDSWAMTHHQSPLRERLFQHVCVLITLDPAKCYKKKKKKYNFKKRRAREIKVA